MFATSPEPTLFETTVVLRYHWEACIGALSLVLSHASIKDDNAMALMLAERVPSPAPTLEDTCSQAIIPDMAR